MLSDNFKGHVYINRNIAIQQVKSLLGDNFVNAIGHEGTIQLVNNLLGLKLTVNRIPVKLNDNDIALVVQVKERLPEGKILSADEIQKLYESNKIQFDLIKV
jgi:hypothetical protein